MTREEASKIIKDGIEDMSLDFADEEQYEALTMAIKALEQEPKTGRWIGHREHCENLGVMPSGLGSYEWCSNCDCGIDVREWHRNHYNYCPNCGAKMVEPQETETWNGYHGQITAPKGAFERIFNDADDDNDI